MVDKLFLETQASLWPTTGVQGFFSISFFNVEDKSTVVDGGPYLFYSIGLFLRH